MRDFHLIIIAFFLTFVSCNTSDKPTSIQDIPSADGTLKTRLDQSMQKGLTDSVIYYSKSLFEAETNVGYIEDLAIYLNKVNRPDLLLEPLSYTIERRPQALKIRLLRGLLYQQLSEHQDSREPYNLKALDDFNAAEIDIKNYELYGGRGWTLLLLKKYQEAIHDFDKALADSSSKSFYNDKVYMIPLIYRGRGIAQAKIKNYKSGLADLDKATSLGDTIAKRLSTEVRTEMKTK